MWFYLNHQLILKNLLITKVTEKLKNKVLRKEDLIETNA